METMICESCGATITPAPSQPCLMCEYCGTVVNNPHYDGSASAPEQDLDAQCVMLLVQQGASAGLPEGVFGAPLANAYAAREALNVPQTEQVYFVFAHGTIWRSFSEGFALCDTGLYYLSDGDSGKRTWEGFATGEISGRPYGGWGQTGSLRVGALTFLLDSNDDNDAAEFLVDFHHSCYRLFTGKTAPAAWRLSDEQPDEQPAAAGSVSKAIATAAVANTVLSAARTLLGGQTHRRTIIPRTTMQHPAARQGARRPPQPPRPTPRMMQRPAAPARPAMPGRHQPRSGRPGGMGRPGSMGRMGGPGRGRR